MIPWDPVAWRVPSKVTSDDYSGSVCDFMRTSNSFHCTFLLSIPNLLLVELEVCEPWFEYRTSLSFFFVICSSFFSPHPDSITCVLL